MRKLVKFLFVVVVLLIVAAFGLTLYIDTAVVQAVERGGTYALGVDTELGEAELGITSGQLDLSQLTVANPAGFANEHFLSLGDAHVKVSLESLLKDVVVVPELALDGIALDIERNSGGMNYGPILESLERLGSGESTPEQPEPAESGGGKKFLVDLLSIRNVSATVNVIPEVGEAGMIKLAIPEIVLEGIGTAEGGQTASELASTIVRALLEATLEAGDGQLPMELLNDLEGKLGSLGDLGVKISGEVISDVQGSLGDLGAKAEVLGEDLGGKVEDITTGIEGEIEEIGGKAEGALEDLEKGLGGILGGKKDKTPEKDKAPAGDGDN